MKSFDEIIGNISKTIIDDNTIKAAFGEPVKLESLTIVPVSRVTVNAGGSGEGSGGGDGKGGRAADLAEKLKGSGSGGGRGNVTVDVTPMGFIYEKDGVPVYTEIK